MREVGALPDAYVVIWPEATRGRSSGDGFVTAPVVFGVSTLAVSRGVHPPAPVEPTHCPVVRVDNITLRVKARLRVIDCKLTISI